MAGEVERLSGKLGLDTTDFKTAIAAANREMRVLESGFKASAAALNDWTKDATGLENRAKSLTSQIDIQAAKVDALAAEHKRLATEQGENSRAAQDAEIKLNKETETLNKMERELGNTEESLQEMASAEEETGDAAEEMGQDLAESQRKAESLRDTINDFGGRVAKVALAGIVAIGAAAVAAAAGITKMVFSAVDAAGELVDLSAKTGLSTTQLQEMQYVGDQLGTSLDTITGAQARLIRSMSGSSKPFDTLGVSVRDVNGNLRNSNDVFNDVIDALGRIENPAERDALAMEIFGKSAQELNPLIKAGSDELARLTEEAHKVGAVMSEDAVSGLESLGDTMASIQASIKGLFGTMAADLAPLFQEIATGVQELFQSEEFQKRVKEITALIRDFVERLIDAFGFLFDRLADGDSIFTVFEDGSSILGSFFERLGLGEEQAEGLAQTIIGIADAVSGFLDVLIPFLQQHGVTLLKVLTAIAAGLAAFSIITTVVGWITGLIGVVTSLAGVFTAAGGGIAGVVAILGGPVTLVIAAVVAAIALLTAAWANNWGGIRDTVTQIWEGYLQPALQALGEWLSVAIPAALQLLSEYWNNVLLPAIQAVWEFLQAYVFPILQLIGEFIATVFIAYLQQLADTWQNVILPAIQVVWAFMQESLFPLIQAIAEFISAVFNLALRVMGGIWQNMILPALQAIWEFLDQNILPIFRTVGEFISTTFQPILEDLGNFLDRTLVPAFEGINNAIRSAVDWISQMADAINNLQLPDWLTPGSPTPWEIGLVGINKAMSELNSQLPQMAQGLGRLNLTGAAGQLSPQAVSNSVTNNESISLYGPLVMQGSTPAGSLGARLKGRKF